MLALKRRIGEAFTIGDDITIHVVDVRSKTVTIGIDAPREMQVDRPDRNHYRPKDGGTDARTDADMAKDGRTDAKEGV